MMDMTHTTTKALPAKATATRQAYGSEHAFIDPSLFNLFWIFVIASFIGLVGETIVSTFMDGFVKNRAGLVWGPFSPLYGLGAVLMTIALNDFKGRSTLLIFTVAAAVGGGLEFVAGWFWKNFFGIVAWSYVDQPLNFGGYTCVGMMIVWGLAGVAWVRAGIPLTMRIIDLIPPQARGIGLPTVSLTGQILSTKSSHALPLVRMWQGRSLPACRGARKSAASRRPHVRRAENETQPAAATYSSAVSRRC